MYAPAPIYPKGSWHFRPVAAYPRIDLGDFGVPLVQPIELHQHRAGISALSSGFYVVQMENADGLITERIRKN